MCRLGVGNGRERQAADQVGGEHARPESRCGDMSPSTTGARGPIWRNRITAPRDHQWQRGSPPLCGGYAGGRAS